MFFEKFPLFQYTLDNGKTAQTLPDILRRIQLSEELRKNNAFFEQYDIKDGETPEIVAEYWYGDPHLHWIILLSNDIIDPRFDWPMSYYNLTEFCKGKYGPDNINKLHHYVNRNEFIVEGYRSLSEESTFDNPISIQLESSNVQTEVNLVMQDFPQGTLFPVSNFMYEDLQNEKKRRINIVKPGLVSDIDSRFTTLINQ
jgi:hypothetical protein